MLTTQQAAERTGIGASTLRAWAKGGRIPSVKVGATYALDENVVASLVKPNRGRPRRADRDSEHERRADRDRPQDAPAGD